MVEAMYELSPGFFKQIQKNFKDFISKEKPNFSCLKNFAYCMHFESVHCDYNPTNHYHVLIDMSKFSADFLKQKNRVQFRVFLQLSSICSRLRIHWRQREMFFKNSCWQWSTTKAIPTDSQKQTLLLPYKSVCQCSRKMSQTNFNHLTAYNETFLDTNFGSKCIKAEKSTNSN